MEFKKGDRLYLKIELLSKIKKEKPWLYRFNDFYQIVFFGIGISNKICVVDFKRTKYDAIESYCFSAAALELYFTKDIPHFVDLKHYV